MPGVELGLSVGGLALAALGHDAPGFVQGLTQRLPHSCADGAGLAVHLTLQPPDDGALALDGAAHALELAGMGIAPGFASQLLALLGKGLLQIDPHLLGRFHQLGASSLQQTAVGGVGNRLVLHRAVHDHAGEFLRLDQLELDSHVDGLRQQFLHTFFAQQLAEFDQGRGVAGAVVFKVRLAREELPARRLAPTLNHALVGLIEGVIEVQQRDHDAQRHTGASGIAGHRGALYLFSEEVQVRHGHTGATFAGEDLGHPCFDLLPGHARGQHGQRMAQIDHVVNTRTEEIVGGGAGKQHGRTPRKLPLLEIKLGDSSIGIHPTKPVFMRAQGVLQGGLLL